MLSIRRVGWGILAPRPPFCSQSQSLMGWGTPLGLSPSAGGGGELSFGLCLLHFFSGLGLVRFRESG